MKKMISVLLAVSVFFSAACMTVSARISDFGTPTAYSTSFWMYGSDTSTAATAEMANSIELSNLQMWNNPNFGTGALHADTNQTGYFLIKMDALPGKVFSDVTYIKIHGRAPQEDDLIGFYAGSTAEDAMGETYKVVEYNDGSLKEMNPVSPAADFTPHFKDKETLYLKVVIKSGEGPAWAALQELTINVNYQDRAEVVKYDNFENYGFTGNEMEPTSEQLGAYRADGVKLNKVDLGGSLHAQLMAGTVTYKFDAPEGKAFDQLFLNIDGRTYNDNGQIPSKIEIFAAGTEDELAANLAETFISRADGTLPKNALVFGKPRGIDLSKSVKGSKTAFVQFNFHAMYDWAGFDAFEISARYQNTDKTLYSLNLNPPVVPWGSNGTNLNAEQLGAVSANDMIGLYISGDDFFPALCGNTNGDFIVKLRADAGTVFGRTLLNYKGRAITVGSSVCELNFYVGDSAESASTLVKEYKGNFSEMHKIQTLDLTQYAQGKEELYLKIAMNPSGGNSGWACLNYLDVTSALTDSLCKPFITDETNLPVSDLQTALDHVIIGINLRHATAEGNVLVGALYNKETGAVEEVKVFAPESVAPNEVTPYRVSFDLTGKDKSKYNIKGIVLDNLTDCRPICVAAEAK